MTQVSTAPLTTDTSTIVSEFGGSANNVEMMIGVGLVKDSEAVFFQYLGEDQTPAALMLPSGKPLTRMQSVQVTGISIAEDVGEFNSTKLNLYVTTGRGSTVMLTSGLTTIWSQCVLTGLMSVFDEGGLNQPINIDSWKGTSKMKPCFAAIRLGQRKMTNNDLYEQLREARSAKDSTKVTAICRDCVNILVNALSGEELDDVEVVVERPEGDFERDEF